MGLRDDQGFASGFAELFQAANNEGEDKPAEGVSSEQGERKEGEEDEGGEDEGALAMLVRQVSHRDVAKHRRGHFDGNQPAERLGG